ncbi:hypothetical protein EUA94_21465 [Nocardioides zhouii]|uniref:RNA polymerase sigma factor 70 region 4 type 2 domain-containing protein n=2 Tax=Nocardioides zhouii TaxID=1168729 RepID=A0A4Q2SGC3_9ACTN|nr:hypothetical protein EUA94_21465 [Nocardioides zhouii]
MDDETPSVTGVAVVDLVTGVERRWDARTVSRAWVWRRRRWREETADVLPESLADAPDHDELVAVRSALAGLAPRRRPVLVLRYYEGLSEAEIAQHVSISPGTVKSHARDGLARMRTVLPRDDGPWDAVRPALS